MKLKELIENLKKFEKEHGDKEVMFDDEWHAEVSSINKVDVGKFGDEEKIMLWYE